MSLLTPQSPSPPPPSHPLPLPHKFHNHHQSSSHNWSHLIVHYHSSFPCFLLPLFPSPFSLAFPLSRLFPSPSPPPSSPPPQVCLAFHCTALFHGSTIPLPFEHAIACATSALTPGGPIEEKQYPNKAGRWGLKAEFISPAQQTTSSSI